MESLTIITNFLGSWLLVAGPIYQAALELREQDLEEERIRAVAKTVTPPKPVSGWWWFLPPIKLVLTRKNAKEYRRDYMAALSHEDSEALLLYISKATAWLMVATGGFLVALTDTHQFTVHYKLGTVLFSVIVIALLVLSIGFTVGNISRSEKITGGKPRRGPIVR